MVRTGGYATGISAGSFMEKETGNAMYANSITECAERLPIVGIMSLSNSMIS